MPVIQPRFGLYSKYLLGESGWKPGVDYNFCAIDALLAIGVTGIGALPASGSPGQQWIDASNDLWSYSNAWVKYTPVVGMIGYNMASNDVIVFDGSAWVTVSQLVGNNIVLSDATVLAAINMNPAAFASALDPFLSHPTSVVAAAGMVPEGNASGKLDPSWIDATALSGAAPLNATFVNQATVAGITDASGPGTAGNLVATNAAGVIDDGFINQSSVSGISDSSGPGTAGNFAALNGSGLIDNSFLNTTNFLDAPADANKLVQANSNGEISSTLVSRYPSHVDQAAFLADINRAALPGDRFFNSTHGAPAFYDGTNWILEKTVWAKVSHTGSLAVGNGVTASIPLSTIVGSGSLSGGKWIAPFSGDISVSFSHVWTVPPDSNYNNANLSTGSSRDFSFIQKNGSAQRPGASYHIGDMARTTIGSSTRTAHVQFSVLAGDAIDQLIRWDASSVVGDLVLGNGDYVYMQIKYLKVIL